MWIRSRYINGCKPENFSYLMSTDFRGNTKLNSARFPKSLRNPEMFIFCVSTTLVSGDVKCPVLAGLPLLTGVGLDKLYTSILEEMQK